MEMRLFAELKARPQKKAAKDAANASMTALVGRIYVPPNLAESLGAQLGKIEQRDEAFLHRAAEQRSTAA